MPPLRDRDVEILLDARDVYNGDLNRNELVEAFKRGGATIFRGELKEIRIQFMDGAIPYDLPLGRGDVDLTGRHKNFRKILEDLARDVLRHNNIA